MNIASHAPNNPKANSGMNMSSLGFLANNKAAGILNRKKPIQVKITGTRVSPAPLKADVMIIQDAKKGMANAINLSTGAPIRTISA